MLQPRKLGSTPITKAVGLECSSRPHWIMVNSSPHRQPCSQIRRLRIDAKMSTMELAQILCVSTSTINNWEKKPVNRWIPCIQMCEIFTCRPNDIIHPQFSRPLNNYPLESMMTLGAIRASFLNKKENNNLEKRSCPPTRIKEWRDQNKWNQFEFAEMLGVSKNTIQNWEGNSKYLDIFYNFSDLCQVFSCNPEDLVDFVPRYQLPTRF